MNKKRNNVIAVPNEVRHIIVLAGVGYENHQIMFTFVYDYEASAVCDLSFHRTCIRRGFNSLVVVVYLFPLAGNNSFYPY